METECHEDNDVASLIELEEALDGLTSEDINRIKRFAGSLAALYHFYSRGRDKDDIIQAAVERVLTHKRKWTKSKVSFVGFFCGVMRSITNHWVDEKGAGVEVQAKLICTDEGDKLDQLENHPSTRMNAEEEMNDKVGEMTHERLIEWIENFFIDDDLVQLVMFELLESKKGPEIQQSLGISQTEYQTIIRRMDRKLAKEGIKWRRNVKEN